MMTIQAQIEHAQAGDLLKIGPGEHRENLLIDKALVLRGSGLGTTLQGLRGSPPTITVLARGVALECFGIEPLDPHGVAVRAEPGTDPQVREVVVHGGRVSGVAKLGGPATATTSGLVSNTDCLSRVSPRVAPGSEALLDAAPHLEAADDCKTLVRACTNREN